MPTVARPIPAPAPHVPALLVPARRKSIAEEVAEHLRREIVTAAIEPGAPVRQDHIARLFGVSHAPVREALGQLAAEGLVVHAVNRGTRVAPLDRAEAAEIGELRGRIEPNLARQAAMSFTGDDDHRARLAIERMAAAGDDIAALMAANEEFHDIIHAAAGKPIAACIARQLRARYARYLGTIWRRSGHARTSYDEHIALLELLAAGDGRAAARSLTTHIQTTTKAMLALLD